jgi:hypothetical protein
MGKVKNWTVEKKDEIESTLINMWAGLGMDIPDNFEDIVQFCYEDVCETADPIEWHSGDVSIAFRRWIEAQGNVQAEDNTGLDGTYGVKLNTLGELRSLMSELNDDDQICIETIDLESGDVQDLYPMNLDVIEGIKLTNGKAINEVRFCQMPNSAPDPRDKQPIIEALIVDLEKSIDEGDTTVLDELLNFLPIGLLIGALPEDDWKNFTAEAMRQTLINKVFDKYYKDDDPKYDGKNRAFLDTLSDDELEMKL